MTNWDNNLQRFISDVNTMVKNSHDLQRDFLLYVGREIRNYLEEVTPKDTGETAKAWKIISKTTTSVTIANTREDVLLRILEGVKGGTKVYPKEARVFRFEIDGEEHFSAYFTTKTVLPNDFMKGVSKNIDYFNKLLMDALVSKHWKVFTLKNVGTPETVKLRNITSTVGLGQGSRRNTNRGRGRISLNRVRTGRKTNRRRLTVVRRRTGHFISRKEVRTK